MGSIFSCHHRWQWQGAPQLPAPHAHAAGTASNETAMTKCPPCTTGEGIETDRHPRWRWRTGAFSGSLHTTQWQALLASAVSELGLGMLDCAHPLRLHHNLSLTQNQDARSCTAQNEADQHDHAAGVAPSQLSNAGFEPEEEGVTLTPPVSALHVHLCHRSLCCDDRPQCLRHVSGRCAGSVEDYVECSNAVGAGCIT
jgi:hypothetical protein